MKVGLSTCSKAIDADLFAAYSKSGISDMELSEYSYDNFDYNAVKKLAKEYAVNLWSLHLPFVPFDRLEISTHDKELRNLTINTLSEIIKKGSDIGVDKFIIHPSGEPIEDNDRQERIKYAKESLSKLADVSERNNAVICVENLPRTCLGHSIDDMKQLVSNDSRLKICYDTNHITIEKPEDIILALADRIVTLHVSDFDFVNERHWIPGEGKIDWKQVMNALRHIGYNGSFMYEVGFACPNTIFRDRPLTTDDFARNANELFNGQTLTVFSSPKPNLGMWE